MCVPMCTQSCPTLSDPKDCGPPGHLPNPGIKPSFCVSPTLAGGFFTNCTTWEALYVIYESC